jgi:hypothetical protein
MLYSDLIHLASVMMASEIEVATELHSVYDLGLDAENQIEVWIHREAHKKFNERVPRPRNRPEWMSAEVWDQFFDGLITWYEACTVSFEQLIDWEKRRS